MSTLKTKLYQDDDFFVLDEVEINSYKSDMNSMEHPFFALKTGDRKDRVYQNGNVTLELLPNSKGLPTIFDKDIFIYAISKMQKVVNQGHDLPEDRSVYFTMYDFLKTINSKIGGSAYKSVEASLSRLKGTTIKTSLIIDENNKQIEAVGFIDGYKILLEKKGKLEIGMVKLTLPKWIFKVIESNRVLKINPDYFRIRKAIDRRIYEIARKHCGNQNQFIISLEKLYLKTGSSTILKKFKQNIKELAEKNDLPDYEIFLDVKKNLVTFLKRKSTVVDDVVENTVLVEEKQQEPTTIKELIETQEVIEHKTDLTESANYYLYESGLDTLKAHENKKITMNKNEIDFFNKLKKQFELNQDLVLSEKQKMFFYGVLGKYGTLKQPKQHEVELSQDEIDKRARYEEKLNACVLELNMVLVGVETGNEYVVNEHGFVLGGQYPNFSQDCLSVGVNRIEQLKELIVINKLKIK